MKLLANVVIYLVTYSLTRFLINGDIGSLVACLAAGSAVFIRPKRRFFAAWALFGTAVVLAASIVLVISRYFDDIGRGEDTSTYWFMVFTYFLSTSGLFAVTLTILTWCGNIKKNPGRKKEG